MCLTRSVISTYTCLVIVIVIVIAITPCLCSISQTIWIMSLTSFFVFSGGVCWRARGELGRYICLQACALVPKFQENDLILHQLDCRIIRSFSKRVNNEIRNFQLDAKQLTKFSARGHFEQFGKFPCHRKEPKIQFIYH